MAETDYDLICGRLPTGERCARPYGHSGRHKKVYVTKVETDYQDDWTEEEWGAAVAHAAEDEESDGD